MLLQNRTTNIDAQTEDGTTPLIFAARLGISDVVDSLIGAKAKVDVTDNTGG